MEEARGRHCALFLAGGTTSAADVDDDDAQATPTASTPSTAVTADPTPTQGATTPPVGLTSSPAPVQPPSPKAAPATPTTQPRDQISPLAVGQPDINPPYIRWTVYPKNAVTSIKKAVDETDALALGTTVSWPITVTVPHLTHETKLDTLTVTDTLDSRLSFDKVSVTPQLDKDTHYTVEQKAGEDIADNPNVTIVVNFTGEGLAALENQQGEEVVVTVHTIVDSIGDGTIVNTAVVNVNDYVGTTNQVHSKWGAIKIVKFTTVTEDDQKVERPLEGAEFQVFATEDDAKASKNPITVATGGKKIDTFISEADGTVIVPGLLVSNSSGDRKYWIRETKAPTGYLPLNEDKNPFSVMVTAGSIEQAVEVQIENLQVPSVLLPLTGGAGTVLFSVAGVTLMVIAAAVVVAGRRRSATSQA